MVNQVIQNGMLVESEEYNKLKNTISEIKTKLNDKTIKPKRREQLLKDLERKEGTMVSSWLAPSLSFFE